MWLCELLLHHVNCLGNKSLYRQQEDYQWSLREIQAHSYNILSTSLALPQTYLTKILYLCWGETVISLLMAFKFHKLVKNCA